MARPGWPERNRAARSFRQLRRFHHVINSDKVLGTHRLPADRRSLFQRWSIAEESNYSTVDADGKTIKLTRVSESTLRKRYRTGLNTFWKFLIDNGYVSGPAPDFSSSSKKNPPAVERDAFHEDELLNFLSRPLFT